MLSAAKSDSGEMKMNLSLQKEQDDSRSTRDEGVNDRNKKTRIKTVSERWLMESEHGREAYL